MSSVEIDDQSLPLLSRHRNSGGSVDMSDESESETDSSLADDENSGQVRRRSSTTSKKRRWLKEEVIAYLLLRWELWLLVSRILATEKFVDI